MTLAACRLIFSRSVSEISKYWRLVANGYFGRGALSCFSVQTTFAVNATGSFARNNLISILVPALIARSE